MMPPDLEPAPGSDKEMGMSDVCCPDDDEPKPEPAKRALSLAVGRKRNTVIATRPKRRLIAKARP